MTAGRRLLAVAATLLLLAACSSSDRDRAAPTHTTTSGRPAICDVYDRDDWLVPSVTIEDSLQTVIDRIDEGRRIGRLLLDAAGPTEQEIIEAGNDANERYRSRLLQEWRNGGGTSLHQRAIAAGFLSFREYVESLALGDPTEARGNQRAVDSLLAKECAELEPLPTDAADADADDIPAGEIIAASTGSGGLHRFSTSGDDLGAIDVPGLDGLIVNDALSPDGRHLAVMTATDTERHLWIVDLRSNTATESTVAGCMDWADDSTVLVWERDSDPTTLVPVGLDGAPSPATTHVALDGCAYRFTPDELLVVRPRVDGAPVGIWTVPATGGEASELIATTCHVISPDISPDGSTISYAAGCARSEQSGVYLANAEGSGQHQIVAAPASGAAWSPDGSWLTFAAQDLARPGDPAGMKVYIASADGAKVGAVTPAGYAWAVWVPTMQS